MAIIGIVLGLVAIGLIFWFRKEQQQHNEWFYGETEASEHGYRALMEDFTNYQVKTDRDFSALEKALEIKSKNIDRLIEKQQKELPSLIGRIVGQLELAQSITPTNRKV